MFWLLVLYTIPYYYEFGNYCNIYDSNLFYDYGRLIKYMSQSFCSSFLYNVSSVLEQLFPLIYYDDDYTNCLFSSSTYWLFLFIVRLTVPICSGLFLMFIIVVFPLTLYIKHFTWLHLSCIGVYRWSKQHGSCYQYNESISEEPCVDSVRIPSALCFINWLQNLYFQFQELQ
jgi:hypothetical protein